MKHIDKWSSVQMRSFIVKALWYDGELQDIGFDDLYDAVKGDMRSRDWMHRFANVWKEEVAATYVM